MAYSYGNPAAAFGEGFSTISTVVNQRRESDRADEKFKLAKEDRLRGLRKDETTKAVNMMAGQMFNDQGVMDITGLT